MPPSSPAVDIGILMYPGAQLSALHGLTDLFQTGNRISAELGRQVGVPLQVSHWSQRPGAKEVERQFITAENGVDRLTAIIVLPSLDSGGADATELALLSWLRRQHEGGAVVCSICAGAFLLAEAGLLEGRSATTHWALRERFAARFPTVRLETDKLIIEDGDIITAGGVMAWVDLGLRLVDRFVGPSVMLEVARFFLVDPSGREQRFYSRFAPRLTHGDEAVLKVQHWLQAHCERPASISAMASVAGLSERTFLRRFHKATGMNPTPYLQTLRVGKARELLEFSSMPFSLVAWKVGYEDPGAFRKVFHRIMGLSPGDYRRRFAVR